MVLRCFFSVLNRFLNLILGSSLINRLLLFWKEVWWKVWSDYFVWLISLNHLFFCWLPWHSTTLVFSHHMAEIFEFWWGPFHLGVAHYCISWIHFRLHDGLIHIIQTFIIMLRSTVSISILWTRRQTTYSSSRHWYTRRHLLLLWWSVRHRLRISLVEHFIAFIWRVVLQSPFCQLTAFLNHHWLKCELLAILFLCI